MLKTNMRKECVAFFDISFHKKTGSGDFIREIIKSAGYRINDYWDDQKINIGNFRKRNYLFVFLFQYMPPLELLQKLKSNIIWAPMYDSLMSTPDLTLVRYSKLVKILSFSKNTTRRFKRLGFEIMEAQYFLKPNASSMVRADQPRLFLWQRRNIDFYTVKKMFDLKKLGKITIKVDPDPGYKGRFPSKADMKKYNIKVINGGLRKDRYIKLLNDCDIFLSPRDFEGIGISFLEAIARGKLVIAKDNPTMNEYIRSGYNGILFMKPKRIDLNTKEFKKIVGNSKRAAKEGYGRWKVKSKELINFFIKRKKKTGTAKHFLTLLKTMASHFWMTKPYH
jgi:hypothetical protein